MVSNLKVPISKNIDILSMKTYKFPLFSKIWSTKLKIWKIYWCQALEWGWEVCSSLKVGVTKWIWYIWLGLSRPLCYSVSRQIATISWFCYSLFSYSGGYKFVSASPYRTINNSLFFLIRLQFNKMPRHLCSVWPIRKQIVFPGLFNFVKVGYMVKSAYNMVWNLKQQNDIQCIFSINHW